MIDLFNIPNSQQDVQIFYANGSAWQTWQKPRKCNYVYIMCIGGGGGGQSGTVASGASSSNNTQGGGSGAVTRALYNSQQIPDRLYIQVGLGGNGGASTLTNTSNPGSSGTRSVVSLQPISLIVSQNLVAISGNAGAAGGVLNTTSAGETVSTQTTAVFYTLSNFISTAGVACTFFAASPIANINTLTSQITCQGAQGGGGVGGIPAARNGGSISETSYTPLIQGGLGTLSPSTNGGNGSNGVTVWKPFLSTGGAGGGNSDLGNGGSGGNGGIGSGGGGGGSCSSGQSGAGGKGGDGLVIIISF